MKKKLQKKVGIFIIHLDSEQTRLPFVHQMVRKFEDRSFPVEIISAIDGKKLTMQDISSVYQKKLFVPYYPFTLSNTEIACVLSYRKVWQRICDKQLDFALILEDDIKLSADFFEALDFAIARANSNHWVRFPYRDQEKGVCLARQSLYRLIAPIYIDLGSMCQLVGRVAAERFLEVTEKFDRPLDTMLQAAWHTKLAVLSVLPPVISVYSKDQVPSTIQLPKKKKSFSDILKREMQRGYYRFQVKKYQKKRVYFINDEKL